MVFENYYDFYIRHERRNGFIGTLSRVRARDERTAFRKTYRLRVKVSSRYPVIVARLTSDTDQFGYTMEAEVRSLDAYDNVYLERKPYKVIRERVATYLTHEVSQ